MLGKKHACGSSGPLVTLPGTRVDETRLTNGIGKLKLEVDG